MKKYWLTFTITALLAGACSNEEVTMQEVDSGTGIEFRSLTDKTITRAAITDETSIVGFTVTGWWDKTGADPTTNYGSNVATDGVYLFNGFTIARGEDEATKWDYSPKRYWPANGKGTVDFFAYSPASSRNLNAGLEDFNGAAIEYTVPQIAETGLQQEDFLVAKSTRLTSGTVALNFQHALSRVKFFAKKSNAGITYVIDKVELINLASTATLDLVNDFPDQTSLAYTTGTPLILWEKDNSSVTDYEVDMSGSPVYLLSDFNSILGTTSAVMVMPQETTLATTGTVAPAPGGGFAIAVSYRAYIGTFYYAGTPTTSKTQYFAVKDPVYSSGDGIAFEIGRQYNFYLTFGGEASATAITFQVNVSDWASEEGHIVPELDDYTTYFGPALITFVNRVSNTSDGGITNGNGDGKVTYDELAAAKLIAYKDADIEKVEPFKGIEYLFAMTTLNFIAVTNTPILPDLVLHSTNIVLNTINFLYSNLAMDTLDVSALPANEVNISSSSGNTTTITTLIKRPGQTVKITDTGTIIIDGNPYSNGDIIQ